MKNAQFSVPLWPGFTPEEIENVVIPFLSEHKHLIKDLYFTCRIPPFETDAMGGLIFREERDTVINNALVISHVTGIPLSATFNNTKVSPSYDNYLKFVEHFRDIYNEGVRNITIPHTSWLRFGLKNEFPDLFVKNTIINRVNTASEVAVLFEEGFDYVNLDRKLMRDEDALKEITKAKKAMEKKLNKKLYISLLWNENCEGSCPIQNEHFQYNFNRTETENAYFETKMGEISPCVIKDDQSAVYVFKSASIPSYYSYINHLNNYVDVYKMHGRENKAVFTNTVNIITQYAKRELINDPFRKVLDKGSKRDKDLFLKKTKNCKFDCWKCRFCDDLAERLEGKK